jgi:DNA-binding MarR family transcriptional regulator
VSPAQRRCGGEHDHAERHLVSSLPAGLLAETPFVTGLHIGNTCNVKGTTSGSGPAAAERTDVAALEMMTRALIGIALEAISSEGDGVTVPQFRLMLALEGLGRVPSSKLAAQLGLAASAITRMVDRLERAGLVQRGTERSNRSIVTVQLTPVGRGLVDRALAHRHKRIAMVLDRMSPDDRAAVVWSARHFARFSGDAVALGAAGPVPL